MKRTIHTLLAFGLALLLSGCFKSVGYETQLIIKPWVQTTSQSTKMPLYDEVLCYAFAADTAHWHIANYEDALAGIASSSKTDEQMEAFAKGEPYVLDGNENWLAMYTNSPSLLLLVVDRLDRIYTYTQLAVGENLPQLYVSILFTPWKTGRIYETGGWIVCNDFYEEPQPEPEPESTPDPAPDEPENPAMR